MDKEGKSKNSQIFLIYLIFSASILIFYPFWIAIQNQAHRLIFFILLLDLFVLSNYLVLNKLEIKEYKSPNKKNYFINTIKKYKELFFILILALIAQIPLLLKPITSYTDEISYISSGMYLEKAINYIAQGYSAILVILAILALYIIFRNKEAITNLIRKRFFIFFLLLCLIGLAYFFVANHFFSSYAGLYAQQSLAQKAMRLLAGLKSIIFALPLALFGYQEFAARLPSLISYLLTAAFSYKLVFELAKNKRFAIYSALIILFLPGFFYFGNLAYEASILAFTLTSSIYFLLKYQKEKSTTFLFYSFMIATAAVLIEKKGIFIWPILFLIILAGHITKKSLLNRENLKSYSILFFISALIFLPYFILNYLSFSEGIEEVHKSSLFLFSNLIIPSKLLINSLLTPYITNIIGAILFFFGLIYSIYLIKTKKSQLNLALVTSYLVFYILTAAYRFSGRPRFIIPVIFVFAILIAQFLVYLEDKSRLRKILTIIFLIFLISNTLYLAYNQADKRYLPMNELFSHIKDSTNPEDKFIKSLPPSSYNFYIFKYNLNFNNFDPTIWEKSENQTADNLFIYMKKTNLTYAFFPLPTPTYDIFFYKPNPASWLDLWDPSYKEPIIVINHELVYDLYEDRYPLFMKKAEFHNGINTLFIVKINETAKVL